MALTNLGALPTDFAISSICSAQLNQVYKIYTSSEFYLLQGPAEQTSCYPSGYRANPNQYYSPGLCPTGFTSACEATSELRMSINNLPWLGSDARLYRASRYGDNDSVDGEPGVGWANGARDVLGRRRRDKRIPDTSGDNHAFYRKHSSCCFLTTTAAENAFLRRIAPYDLLKTKTKTKTTKTETHPTTTKTSSSSTGGKTGHHGKSSSGLGSGTIAGIVVGVVAGVVSAATPLWLKLRKRWQQRNDKNDNEENDDDAKSQRSDPEKAAGDQTVEEPVAAGDAQSHTNVPRRPSA
ncbi:hypothetical protein F5Y03DRAFT_406273 [Xylaria venustula]|nr:hypothetical protein F5Y03DRAFT_406273 [Xylaria venustula]